MPAICERLGIISGLRAAAQCDTEAPMTRRLGSLVSLALVATFFAGCETMPEGIHQARLEMAARIQQEQPGDYWIGRRYFKPDYKFWGYLRRPGQAWSTSQLVMLNEKQKLAPDREQVNFGSDNDYEYKIYGYFSGDKVYEPASNTVYPEFVLQRYELISTHPPPIFKTQLLGRGGDNRYLIEKPE
jgi:hypothetical protein